MFTGIVECTASVVGTFPEGSNLRIRLVCETKEPIYIDQSIAHNGVCLTVVAILTIAADNHTEYEVVAVEETLRKTNIGQLKAADRVNLELSLKAGQRMDGHFVQGHADGIGIVTQIESREGSWNITFNFDPSFNPLIVDKGSICVNGVSLTVVNAGNGTFSVTVIPYTWEHTNLSALKPGDAVNLEFDILGKYFLRSQSFRNK